MIRKLNHPSSHSFSHPAKLPRYSIGKVAAATPSLEEVSQLHANLPSSHSHSAVDAIKGRGLLLKWLTHHLAGDQLAAEYVLLHCMSRVYRRIDDVKLGDLPLNLTGYGASTVFATYCRDKPTNDSTLLFFLRLCACVGVCLVRLLRGLSAAANTRQTWLLHSKWFYHGSFTSH